MWLLEENYRIQGQGIEVEDQRRRGRQRMESEKDPPGPLTCSFPLHPFLCCHWVKTQIVSSEYSKVWLSGVGICVHAFHHSDLRAPRRDAFFLLVCLHSKKMRERASWLL